MANMQLFENRNNLPVPNAPRMNFIAALGFLAPVAVGALATLMTLNPAGAIVGILLGLLLAQSPKIARQWERAVVLRGQLVVPRAACSDNQFVDQIPPGSISA